MGFQTKLLESGQPGEHDTSIDALVSEAFIAIFTVGSSMGDARALPVIHNYYYRLAPSLIHLLNTLEPTKSPVRL